MLAHARAVDDHGAHAHERAVPDGAAVHDGAVPHRHVAADDGLTALVHMHAGVFLDVRVLADHDAAAQSPRKTAFHNTVQRSPTSTSPTTTALSAMRAVGWMRAEQ